MRIENVSTDEPMVVTISSMSGALEFQNMVAPQKTVTFEGTGGVKHMTITSNMPGASPSDAWWSGFVPILSTHLKVCPSSKTVTYNHHVMVNELLWQNRSLWEKYRMLTYIILAMIVVAIIWFFMKG